MWFGVDYVFFMVRVLFLMILFVELLDVFCI